MEIEVRLFAGLNKYVKGTKSGDPFAYQVEDDSALSALLHTLGIPEKEAFVILVNGQASTIDTVLKEGDRVGIFPPVGGG